MRSTIRKAAAEFLVCYQEKTLLILASLIIDLTILRGLQEVYCVGRAGDSLMYGPHANQNVVYHIEQWTEYWG